MSKLLPPQKTRVREGLESFFIQNECHENLLSQHKPYRGVKSLLLGVGFSTGKLLVTKSVQTSWHILEG